MSSHDMTWLVLMSNNFYLKLFFR